MTTRALGLCHSRERSRPAPPQHRCCFRLLAALSAAFRLARAEDRRSVPHASALLFSGRAPKASACDELVPLLHAEELFEAAPDPEELHVIAGPGTTTSSLAGGESAAVIAARRRR